MDSISQAALGAAIGEAVLGKKTGNKGAILGAIIATIPDLDVVLYLFYDKLEMLSIHRGYSHSIVFSLLGAFLMTYILHLIKWTRGIPYFRLWLFTWLVFFTHMLLDAFTTYGTQLFLPFSDQRVGFDSINVVDPVYTVPLLLGLLFSKVIFKNKALFNYIGLGVSTLYLIVTLGVKNHVYNHFQKELSSEDIDCNSLLTVPVGSANVNWYGVAKSDDTLYMQKYSVLKGPLSEFEKFEINEGYLEGLDSIVVAKMKWFAKGYYTVEKHEDVIRFYNLQVDMRGIVKDGKYKAPTKGYFEINCSTSENCVLSSGSH